MYNLNILSYCIYLITSILTIIKIGKICYNNGMIFLLQYSHNKEDICKKTNDILLLGYYLLNIGYCAIQLLSWNYVNSLHEMIESIAEKLSLIVFIITGLHYLNLFFTSKFIIKLV